MQTMYNEKAQQFLLIQTGATHTHTHPKRNGGRGLYLHLPASCGLLELVRWRDSNPPPTTPHQAPGTKNGATDASQHGHGPDENASSFLSFSFMKGRTLLAFYQASLACFDQASLACFDQANLACFDQASLACFLPGEPCLL